jgi:hypothetical protein
MCYVKAEQTFHVTSSAATLSISSFPAQRFSAASSVFALFSGASETGESVKSGLFGVSFRRRAAKGLEEKKSSKGRAARSNRDKGKLLWFSEFNRGLLEKLICSGGLRLCGV